MSTTIYAHTGQTPPSGYVGYINVRGQQGKVVFTVRSEGESSNQGEIALTPEQAEQLATALVVYLNEAPKEGEA